MATERRSAFRRKPGQGGLAAVPADPVAQSQGRSDQRRLLYPVLPKVGQTTVEQILLSGIRLDHSGAQLDSVGVTAVPLGQGQGGADPERQAVQEGGEAIQIDPPAIHLSITMRRVELAPERPGRQQRMTRKRSIEPPYGQGRRLQLDDHIIVGEPIPHARQRVARMCGMA